MDYIFFCFSTRHFENVVSHTRSDVLILLTFLLKVLEGVRLVELIEHLSMAGGIGKVHYNLVVLEPNLGFFWIKQNVVLDVELLATGFVVNFAHFKELICFQLLSLFFRICEILRLVNHS